MLKTQSNCRISRQKYKNRKKNKCDIRHFLFFGDKWQSFSVSCSLQGYYFVLNSTRRYCLLFVRDS